MLAVVVLAAGKGTRMRSDVPKVLHPLLGAPLLEHALERAEELQADRTIVVIGYGRDAIRAAFPDRGVVWAVQEEQLGTGHAARVGVEALGGAPDDCSVLVLNGDLPLLRHRTLARLVERHRESRAAVTVLSCEKSDPTGFGRILRTPDGSLRAIVEESDADETTRLVREVNVGTYVFDVKEFLKYYGRIDRDNEQGELYLTDVVVEAARAGERVECVAVEDETETAQVNSRREMAQAAEILRGRLLDDFMDSGVSIDDPRTTYIEKGVRIGRDTRILPFTVIRRGVEIASGCEVGPFAHLRPGTHLEARASVGNFVEVKNSSLGEGAKVRHLSYVGDGQVGARVNIGAGTIFANYDGKAKNATIVEEGAFIGSGTILVAPIRIGKNAMTGAGAVVLRGRDVADGEVVVGVPARPIRKEGSG